MSSSPGFRIGQACSRTESMADMVELAEFVGRLHIETRRVITGLACAAPRVAASSSNA